MKIDQNRLAQTVTKQGGQVKAKKNEEVDQKDGFVPSAGAGEVAPGLSKQEIMQLQPKEEKPGLVSTVIKQAGNTSKEAGDAVGRVIGSAVGIGGAVGGAYLGAAGGAATMGLLGLGAGVPGAILAGKGGLSILGTAFSTGGVLAKAGIVAGTACGIVGGYYLGSKLGYVLGAVPTAVVAAPVGAIDGLGKAISGKGADEIVTEKHEPEVKRKRTKAEQIGSTVLGGVGLLSGAAGGAAIGGIVASGAALTAGLIAKDVALSAITSTGVTGAAVGAAVGAVLLGVGGYKIIDTIADASHSVARSLSKGKERVELEMKGKELGERIEGLKKAEGDLSTKKAESEKYFAAQFESLIQAKADEDKHVVAEEQKTKEEIAAMDQKVIDKSKEFASIMADVAQKTENQAKIADERASKKLDEHKVAEENKYVERKVGLENYEASMDARDTEYDRKNKEMDKIVDEQSDFRRDQTASELEAKFQTRKTGLDQREDTLKDRQKAYDDRKADMPNLIKTESDKHYAKKEGELKADLNNVEKGLQNDLDNHKATLKRDYDQQAREYDNQYDNRENTLKSAYSVKAASVATQQQQVDRLKSELQSKQRELENLKSSVYRKNQEASSILSSLPGKKSQLLNEASRARQEASSVQSQISSSQGTLSSAEREADSARSDYQSSAARMNQLQADISRLQNQINNLMG